MNFSWQWTGIGCLERVIFVLTKGIVVRMLQIAAISLPPWAVGSARVLGSKWVTDNRPFLAAKKDGFTAKSNRID